MVPQIRFTHLILEMFSLPWVIEDTGTTWDLEAFCSRPKWGRPISCHLSNWMVKSLKAKRKHFTLFSCKTQMGSAIRELYIKTVWYIPAPNTNMVLFKPLPTRVWNSFPKLGVTVASSPSPHSSSSRDRVPSSPVTVGPANGGEWSSAFRPLWRSGPWWPGKRLWGNSAESSRWCQQKVCT